MTFELTDIIINPELEKEFLSLGEGVKVISPISFATRLKKVYKKALDQYQKD